MPGPVLAHLQDLGAELTVIFNTHHHLDHVGGNQQLLRHFPEAVVYGGEQDRGRIPGQQVFLQEGDEVTFCRAHRQSFLCARPYAGAHCLLTLAPPKLTTGGTCFVAILCLREAVVVCFEGTPEQNGHFSGQAAPIARPARGSGCAHEYTLKKSKVCHNRRPQ